MSTRTLIGNIKGPKGDTGAKGEKGDTGTAATITVGTVSTTAYGNPAQVVNVGDEHDAIFNIVIPQGAPGATVTQMDNLALNTITAATDEYPQIQIGDTGRTIFGKIVKFFQDLVSKLALKVNYTDSLTLEEIEASSDLTNKVASASAAESLMESLSDLYTLLWTNSNPSAEFTYQTISLDLSEYDIVEVFTKSTIGSNARLLVNGGRAQMVSNSGTTTATTYGTISNYRMVTASTSGITFDNNYQVYTGQAATITNSNNIPYAIYGIKLP